MEKQGLFINRNKNNNQKTIFLSHFKNLLKNKVSNLLVLSAVTLNACQLPIPSFATLEKKSSSTQNVELKTELDGDFRPETSEILIEKSDFIQYIKNLPRAELKTILKNIETPPLNEPFQWDTFEEKHLKKVYDEAKFTLYHGKTSAKLGANVDALLQGYKIDISFENIEDTDKSTYISCLKEVIDFLCTNTDIPFSYSPTNTGSNLHITFKKGRSKHPLELGSTQPEVREIKDNIYENIGNKMNIYVGGNEDYINQYIKEMPDVDYTNSINGITTILDKDRLNQHLQSINTQQNIFKKTILHEILHNAIYIFNHSDNRDSLMFSRAEGMIQKKSYQSSLPTITSLEKQYEFVFVADTSAKSIPISLLNLVHSYLKKKNKK